RYLGTYLQCLNNTALVYRDLQETLKAEATLNEALNRSRELEFLPGIAMSLNNLGLIEIERKSYQEALSVYREALQINQQLNDSIAIAGTYNNIGLIHEETGSYRKALEYYKSSLQISERLKYLYGISNTSTNIGKIYSILQQSDSAKAYLDRGLAAAQLGGMLHLQQQSYLQLAELYQSTGQYQKALGTYREYSTVKDSIFNLESSKQIADMEAKYETEKKEKENVILRKDNELHKTAQRLLIVAISALIILAVLLFGLFRYKARLLRQRTVLFEQEQKMKSLELEKKELERQRLEDQMFAEQEINRLQQIKLEEQNRKLAATALQITGKNKILTDILEEVDKTRKEGVADTEACFRQIKRTVNANLNLDKDWQQFKRHFEEVHPDFFIRLNQRYPDLTSGEQKICAYYRINLNTNEIAQILNVTISGVQKSRHRLRKKMRIDSATELAEFMLTF
ncbi:MAG: tetratricopeptide repeat protein, partial [bacterium]